MPQTLAACLALAAVCCLGAGPAAALALGIPQLVWFPVGGIGLYVLGASFIGLVAARALVPALAPGAFLEPGQALKRCRALLNPTVLAAGVWLILVTAATSVAETEVILPCPDLSLDSCFESVPSRGFPYPFLQREFLPLAFTYDLLLLAVAHSPFLILARRQMRAA